MNVFDFTDAEIADMDGGAFAQWKRQWVSDFTQISRMIRFQKCQVAEAARYHDLVDNSSYVAAGRCISQRNLRDCQSYAHSLMELLEAANIKRRANRIMAQRNQEADEKLVERDENEAKISQFLDNYALANEMYDKLLNNQGAGLLLIQLLDKHMQK